MKKELCKTGIAGIDRMLGGGLPQGAINTVSGPTGSGRSTLALQFLVNGARKYGETGLYVAIEESHEQIYRHMSYKGWNLEELESTKQLLFLDYPPHEVDQFLSQNSAIGELVETMGVSRLVIDSIMPIALLFADQDERKKGFLEIINNIRKWKTTTIITAEEAPIPGRTLPRTNYGIEALSDGWIHMDYRIGKKEERKRGIEVLKMKGANPIMKRFPLEISDAGINVKVK
jgi:circadian clock protein KaiC